MADNQALGELAAQDRYDPIVPAPVRLSQPQVLGGLADLGSDTVDPVVLPQNPNPLADNPLSHYVAQKLFGLGQNAVSALSVPGDVWKGNLDPTSDEGMNRAIGLAQMITEAPRGGGAGPGTVLGSGIRAYHGSPYDFDRFDMNQIGTGEGAQAYGHGLYFAEAEPVAKAYRDQLKDATWKAGDNGETLPKGNAFNLAMTAMQDAAPGLHPDHYRGIANQLFTGIENSGSAKKYLRDYELPGGQFANASQAASEWALARDLKSNPGRMYEVNINAHPDEFLDYDRPLNQQGDYITSRFGSSGNTGAQYQQLMTRGQKGNQIDFANMASSAGIPGIKYLDQGSRGSGAGTSNYVMFNDKLIDILRKYGLAGLTAGAGATAAGQQMDNSAPFGMIGAVPVAGGAMGSLARQDDYQ